MDSTQSPDLSGQPDFWLSSRELLGWAPQRACRVLGPVESPSQAPALLVSLDPPMEEIERVALAPRYEGYRLDPAPGEHVVVNIFSVDDEPMPLIGVGEVYATPEEAAAPLAEMNRYMFESK
jgi:hypothetical protein